MARKPDAPLAMKIVKGTHGLDVLAVKRALARAGFYWWAPFYTQTCGQRLVDALAKFQTAVVLPVSGQYGEHTHADLLAHGRKGHPGEYAYDVTAVELMSREALRCTAYRKLGWNLPYSQSRPIEAVVRNLRQKVRGVWMPIRPSADDWSGDVIGKYYVVGLISKLGPGNQRGDGNTYSLEKTGRAIPQSQLQPGDLVLYNVPGDSQGPPNHVGMYVGHGQVIDHGQPGGPFLNPVDVEPIWDCRTYF